MAQADADPQPQGSGSLSLPVVETFHSLQGEGLHAGRSAFFIRLAGCSVGCRWCDTKHSWPEAAHPQRSIQELGLQAAEAADQGAAFVVITGGEPLHHPLDGLCEALNTEISCRIGAPCPLHLETSGVDPLSGPFDWITLSPKRHTPPTTELLAQTMAAMAAQVRANLRNSMQPSPALLLQPGHDSPEGHQLAIDFVKANPQWRLSLQTHKLLGVR